LAIPAEKIAVEGTGAIANKIEVHPGDRITILEPPAHLRVAANALSHVGSTDFKACGHTYHCNTEVIAAMKQSGLKSPGWRAGQFGDPELTNRQLPKLHTGMLDDEGKPTGTRLGPHIAGEIDAWKHDTPNASGHVLTNLGSDINVIDERSGGRQSSYYKSNENGLVVNPGSFNVSIDSLDRKIHGRHDTVPTLERLPVDTDQ
jgi:hypothetical protein